MQYNVNTCRLAYDQDRCRVFFSLRIFSLRCGTVWGVRDQLCVYCLFPLARGFGGSNSSRQACVVSELASLMPCRNTDEKIT